MNPRDQKKITKNLMRIRKTIQKDVPAITERLVEEKVLARAVTSEISSVRPCVPHLQCGVLINKLLRSGPDAYEIFIKILEEKGYSTLVANLENTTYRDDNEPRQLSNDRERTFIIPSPRIPDRLQREQEQPSSITKSTQGDTGTADEVRQLERMMTFVLTRLDEKDKNNNKVDFKKEFRQKLIEESKGSGEVVEFFKTLRYNSFSLTNQNSVH